jgi:flagellar export protein FliJ
VKAYKFRLTPVLHVRRIQEEQARAALARARIDAARAAEETTKRRGLLGMARKAGLPSGSSSSWRAEHDRQERLTEAVLASRAAELRASELVATRLEDWNHAAREVAAIERLDEKARAQYLAEMNALDQRDTDEQASARHARAQARTRTTTTIDTEDER